VGYSRTLAVIEADAAECRNGTAGLPVQAVGSAGAVTRVARYRAEKRAG